MSTNLQGARPTTRPGDPTVVDTTTTPVVTPTVGGVAVYDQHVDKSVDPSLRLSTPGHNEPAAASSTGSIMGWIIGAIVLIILAYFLMQFVF